MALFAATLSDLQNSLAEESIESHLVWTNPESLPKLHVAAANAFEVCQTLRDGTPRVFVGHSLLDQGLLVINAIAVRSHQQEALATALKSALKFSAS